MDDPNPFDEFDEAMKRLLPQVGAIAVNAARVEWGLAELVHILTGKERAQALRLSTDRSVKEIKRATREREVRLADPVNYWAARAENLLNERGMIMHSRWSVTSDVDPADLMRTGWPEESLRQFEPNLVSSRRLREPAIAQPRSQSELSTLALDLHRHMTDLRDAWLAAAELARTSARRGSRSPSDQTSALVHIGYEAHMCVYCATRLSQDPQPAESNAHLESLLLHARALHDFLLGSVNGRRPDDLLRTDFGPEWSPRGDDSPPDVQEAAARLALAVPDMNKHLSHLTWARFDDGSKPTWTYIELTRAVATLVRAWATHLEKSDIDAVVKASAGTLRTEIEQALPGLPPG